MLPNAEPVFLTNLEHNRIEKGLSRRDVANAIGQSQSTVYRLEHNKRTPSLETLCLLGICVGPLELSYGNTDFLFTKITRGKR